MKRCRLHNIRKRPFRQSWQSIVTSSAQTNRLCFFRSKKIFLPLTMNNCDENKKYFETASRGWGKSAAIYNLLLPMLWWSAWEKGMKNHYRLTNIFLWRSNGTKEDCRWMFASLFRNSLKFILNNRQKLPHLSRAKWRRRDWNLWKCN